MKLLLTTICLLQLLDSASATVAAARRVWMTAANTKRRYPVQPTPRGAVCSPSSIKLVTKKENYSRNPVPQRRNAKTRVYYGNVATIIMENLAPSNAAKKPISVMAVMQCHWSAPYWWLPASLSPFSVEWQGKTSPTCCGNQNQDSFNCCQRNTWSSVKLQ